MWMRNDAQYDFIFSLDESCEYSLETNHLQINKIAGIAFGPHHVNSIRIGWTGDLERRDLYAYYYLGGSRFSEKLCEWTPNIRYHATIYRIGQNCLGLRLADFVTGVQLAQLVMVMNNRGLKYRLGPYFGGKMPAPHDVRVNLEWL